MAGFNLDAILGEAEDKPMTYKQQVFNLPGELPGSAVAPFLSEDLGLVDIIAEVLTNDDTDENGEEKDYLDSFFDVLKRRPTLPRELLEAAKASLDKLLGERAEAFYALDPSVPAYFAIARNLVAEYGVTFADFFGSGVSSATAGTTSSATSSESSDSTPEVSGETPATPPAPSESAGS